MPPQIKIMEEQNQTGESAIVAQMNAATIAKVATA